jgi:molybdate transport system permease protein
VSVSVATSAAPPAGTASARSDLPFLIGLGIIGSTYVVLIVAMLVADASYTTPGHLLEALASREIRYAIKLSLLSCSITAILSLWVAVPAAYLMSRYRFPGKWLVDAILDIPIVLPPLVIGLSLLILFQTRAGLAIQDFTQHRMGTAVAYGLLPLAAGLLGWAWARGFAGDRPERRRRAPLLGMAAAGVTLAFLGASGAGGALAAAAQARLGTRITFEIPSVILAQFAVACAFAVRTLRVAFDQISPRSEQVALTLGCSRSQAFWMVVLPEAQRGLLTAWTIAWARSLGEFGPILVFSGATRMRTEVLSTTVFLELSVGNLRAAVAVSLLMVLAAAAVLVVVRLLGLRGSGTYGVGGAL